MSNTLSRYAWYYGAARGEVLHHIPGGDSGFWARAVEWHEPEDRPREVATCGRTITLQAPGVSCRMGMPRCQRCCKLLGIPQGFGGPYNDPALNGDAQ